MALDTAKDFLQISVHSAGKDVQKFLLIDKDGSVRHMRFRRVPFGNTASPFLLHATIKFHLSNYPQNDIVQELHELYGDNWLSGGDSINEVYYRFQFVYEIFKEANMSLEKVVANNISIAYKLSDKVYSGGEDEPTRVLGLKWCNRFDTSSFEGLTVDADVDLIFTKRTVLSLLAKIFDPLGLISPYVMFAKILFQEIWMVGLKWDEELPSNLRNEFVEWVKVTEDLKNFNVERCYFQNVAWNTMEYFELHGYGDASLKGYGACVYIRICSVNCCQVSLFMSKSRVAPVEKSTLPRLELVGALLCARLVLFVKNALHINVNCKIYCWTDSTITLGWIKEDPSKKRCFCQKQSQ